MVTSLVKLSASGAGCGVGFAASGWVVAHGDLKSQPIAQHALKPLLPQPRSAAVAATGVSQDQQVRGRWKGDSPGAFPPVGNDIDREGWRVGRLTNVDRTAVVEDIVDAVRRGPPQAVAQKVVDVDGDGLEAPGPTSLLEVANQLLFLAVDADDRLAGRCERGDLLVDVGELDVTVGVIRASFELLAVDVQRIIQLAQQAADGRWAERVASLFQAFAQRPQAAADPLLRTHWIASRFGPDQCLQRGKYQRRFFSTDGRPPPGWRTRSAGWSASEAANSSRPRRIVFSSTPVISNSKRSAPCPSRCDSTARYQRRCCSSSRLSNRFIRRWDSRSGCSSPEPHSAHWQDRTTPVGTLRSPSGSRPQLLRLHYSHSVSTGRGLTKPEVVFLQPLNKIPTALLLLT